MVVYWGMFIWVFVINAVQPDEKNPLRSNDARAYRATWGMAWALMAPVIVFAMFRTAPIDTQTYIYMFEAIPDEIGWFTEWIETSYEDSQLFYGIQMVFKCLITVDVTWWLALIAVVEGSLIMYVLRRYSTNMAISVYIFMGSTMFIWMYNGIRQFLVVCILFALTDSIIKNKWYIYVPVTLICGGIAPICEVLGLGEPPWFLGGFHQSALMMIPIFFLVRGKVFNWRVLLFVAVFVVLLMSGGLDTFLESATETTVYSQDLEYVQMDDGAHPLRAVVPAIPLLMAIIKRKELASDKTPQLMKICVNMSVITVALYVASVFTSGIFVGRLPIYTEVYNLILIPWLLTQYYRRDQNIIAIGMYGAYLMWFVYQMHIAWGGLSYASETFGMAFYGGTW